MWENKKTTINLKGVSKGILSRKYLNKKDQLFVPNTEKVYVKNTRV